MASAPERGPPVDRNDYLYRGITHHTWWDEDEKRVTSAAFTWESFSCDMASRTTEQESLARLRAKSPQCGLTKFACAKAVELGFDPRAELDDEDSSNIAHANVYCDLPNKQRKKRARDLAESCFTVVEPTFGT